MNNNIKANQSSNSKCIIMSGVKAAFIGFMIMLIMFLLSAAICLKSDSMKLNFSMISYAVFIIISFISGCITALSKCDKKIFAALTSVFVLLVLTFIMLAIVSDFSLEIKSLILIPVSVFSSILGCMLLKNRKKRH